MQSWGRSCSPPETYSFTPSAYVAVETSTAFETHRFPDSQSKGQTILINPSLTISDTFYYTPVMMSSPPRQYCTERGGEDHFSTIKRGKGCGFCQYVSTEKDYIGESEGGEVSKSCLYIYCKTHLVNPADSWSCKFASPYRQQRYIYEIKRVSCSITYPPRKWDGS